MDVFHKAAGQWVIVHAGKEIDQDFRSEEEAWAWADKHVDDQVFDEPNDFSPPLQYRPLTSRDRS